MIDAFIKRHKLQNVYAYLDDITVTRTTEEGRDANLQRLPNAAKSNNLTLNKEKSKFKVTKLNLLSYSISHQEDRPVQERLQALLDMKPPDTNQKLKRALGLCSYYARSIESFSDKAAPLLTRETLPLQGDALKSFTQLKSYLRRASLGIFKDELLFAVETNASDIVSKWEADGLFFKNLE